MVWISNYFVIAADSSTPFLFLETGEKFATQETAGPTVRELTSYLGNSIGISFEPHIFNDPQNAYEFSILKKPSFGIVTPGFYLSYRTTLGMIPLLEVKRAQTHEQRYLLIANKNAPSDLTKWNEKKIATTLAAEKQYVIDVILQNKLGRDINVVPTFDVEGSVLEIAEGFPQAEDAVLMDETSWKMFEDEPDLVTNVKSIFRSNELPRSLVVFFPTNANSFNPDQLKNSFINISQNEQGRKIMSSIRVDAFVEINYARLKAAQALYRAP